MHARIKIFALQIKIKISSDGLFGSLFISHRNGKNLIIHAWKWHLRPWKWRLFGRESHLWHKSSEHRRRVSGVTLTIGEVQETRNGPYSLVSRARDSLSLLHITAPESHALCRTTRDAEGIRRPPGFLACMDSESRYPSDKWENSVGVKEQRTQNMQYQNIKTVFRLTQPSWSTDIAVLSTFQNHRWPVSLNGFLSSPVPSVTGWIQGQGHNVLRTNDKLILLLCFTSPVVDQ